MTHFRYMVRTSEGWLGNPNGYRPNEKTEMGTGRIFVRKHDAERNAKRYNGQVVKVEIKEVYDFPDDWEIYDIGN